MSGFLIGPCGVAPAPGAFDAQTTAWAAAVVAAGGAQPSNTRLGYVDTLIKAYRAEPGLYAKVSKKWWLCGEDSFQGRTCLFSLQTITSFVGSPTFTANKGYDGGGTAALLTGFITDSNFTSVGAGAFDCSISTSNAAGAAGSNAVGANTSHHYINPFNGSSLIEFEFGGGTFPSLANPNSNRRGLYLLNSTSSTNVDVYVDSNAAVSKNAGTMTAPTKQFLICAENDGFDGVTSGYTGIVSSFGVYATLTSSQAAAKQAADLAFIASVGA